MLVHVYTGMYWYIPACTVLSDNVLSDNFLLNQLVDTTRYKAVHCSMRTAPKCPVPLNETVQDRAVQGLCTVLYCLIQGYRTLWYFQILPCTVMYPLTDFKESSVSESTVHADICQYILVYISMYQHIPIHTK